MGVWIVFVQLLFQSSVSVHFTVDLERREYNSDFGGEVQMGCTFQPIPANTSKNLQLSWHWITRDTEREVYRLVDGEEHLPPVNSHYQGRVSLLRSELNQGWARLKLSALQINDSGMYQCLVKSDHVADYKEMTLSVTALYQNVTKLIERRNNDKVQLTCESKGYPESPVSWTDSKQQSVDASTSNKTTPEQLIQVVSHVLVSPTQRNSYTCQFERGGSSATFHIPEDLHPDRERCTGILISISLLVIAVTALVIYVRCVKGRKKAPTSSVEEEPVSSSKTDNLRKLRDHFCCEDLSAEPDAVPRILNRHGQTVELSSIVGETGEKVLLEGPAGS